MMNPEEVKKFLEDYNVPYEILLRGTTLFTVEAEKDGKVETFTNVPMDYWKKIELPEEPAEYKKEDYFSFDEPEYFELLDAEEEDETELPEGYEIVKIVDFADGCSLEDLYFED
jgi:hypothetical protein